MLQPAQSYQQRDSPEDMVQDLFVRLWEQREQTCY